jgi:hypothetical protein
VANRVCVQPQSLALPAAADEAGKVLGAVMKTKKEKSSSRVLRDVGGKNILFVNDIAVGKLKLRDEFEYSHGDPVGMWHRS